MPFTEWDRLNTVISSQDLAWSDIRARLLSIIGDLDHLRRTDQIEEGPYRQKGNRFRNTIRALIRARCGVDMPNRRVSGRTDRHDLDLVWEQQDEVLIAIEAKMIGSPAHVRLGRRYVERSIGIDIDKRTKEMKYTAIDLKRSTAPEGIGNWSDWRTSTQPHFAVALLMRLAGRNRVDAVKRKVEGLAEYVDAVGLALYRENSNGTLSWVPVSSSSFLDIGELVNTACTWVQDRQ